MIIKGRLEIWEAVYKGLTTMNEVGSSSSIEDAGAVKV